MRLDHEMMDNYLRVRTPLVSFYLLRDDAGLYLIDTGFVGGVTSMQRVLRAAGWDHLPILGILLTHGHLDHIWNVAQIVKSSNAWVAAPRLDEQHYEGRPEYSGVSRVAGIMEGVAKGLFRYQSFQADRLLDHGDRIDVWGGLRVVSLPGHTAGHSGFYSESRRLLFCGDLFASLGCMSHFPPRIFNAESSENRESAVAALQLKLEGVLPNHCNSNTPKEHLRMLEKLALNSTSRFQTGG